MNKSIQSVVEKKEKFISKIFHMFHQPLLSDHVPYIIVEAEVDWFITDLLSKERTDIVERIRNHAKQNTYEGEAAKVYKTTMAEVEEIIQSNN